MSNPRGRGTDRGRGRGRNQRNPQQQQTPPQEQSRAQAPPAQLQGAWGRGQAASPAAQQQPRAQATPPQPQGAWGRGQAASPASVAQQQPRAQGPPSQAQGAWGRGQASQPQQSPAGTQAQPQGRPFVPSGGGGDTVRTEVVTKQLSKLSVDPSEESKRKKFEKPEILITRPEHAKNKKGNYGKVVRLQTNYFEFKSSNNWSLYQYRVDFSPEEDRTTVKRRLFNQIPNTLFVPNIFDGSILTTLHHHKDPIEFTVTHTEDKSKVSNIKIRLVAELNNRQDYGYFQLFNLLSRRGLENLKLQLIGRNYYDPAGTIILPDYKLEVWPGYLTSIRQHEHSTLMCAEIVGKVMRQETIYDILQTCINRNPKEFKKNFMNEIVGTVVLTSYTDRTYRIDDIDFSVNPGNCFEKDGEQVSYAKYLNDRYQVKIQNMTQPMLVSKANARQRRSGMPELIYLVPELCRTTGLTDQMRNNFHLMKEVGKYTCADPNIRIQKLLSFSQRLHSNARTTEQWKQWGLSLGKELVQVDGREMPPEEIYFGNNAKEKTSDWTRALQSMKTIVSQGQLDNWFIIHPRNSRCIQELLNMLYKASTGMSFRMGKPQCVPIQNDNPITYVNTIESIMSKTTPQLIFCLVSSSASNRYSAIKQKCCVDRPVPSQVVREQNVMKRNAFSIMTNIVIQMNCKIGGVPWKVGLPSPDIMIIGFDVCHDTAKSGFDYGAMVASINSDCTRYHSAVSSHEKGQEICSTLAEHIQGALMSYRRLNGKLPRRIFMYRDGVGEGQLNAVTKVEVNKIKGMLKNVYGESPPATLTYTIVTKRINTRYFLRGENPYPGTVVDDVITDPDKYDFFLVSAKANAGTITPTSYNVIYDDNKLKPEQLQRFTFKLTHLYFNTSKTVRVPAPCHYAHKLAFLVSQYIHCKPSDSLSDLLYFL